MKYENYFTANENVKINHEIAYQDNTLGAINCSHCGDNSLYIKPCNLCGSETFDFVARSSEIDFIENGETITNNRWFHATQRTNWMDRVINSSIMVHVGGKATVHDVVTDLLFPQDEFYLWELEISPKVSIAPWVTVDLDSSWTNDIRSFYEVTGYDMVSYLNLFEGTGHISQIVNPSFLKPLAVQKVDSIDDLRALWNM